MRELVIGDIHGCLRSLRTLLDVLKPEAADTIVFLGDYIDRGPDSCGVIDTILDLNRQCTVVALAGNHEKMLLGAETEPRMLAEWLTHGGQATLDSYCRRGYERTIAAIPPRHWRFFTEQTLDYWETDKRIFVHASIDPEHDLANQPDYLLFWQRFTDPTVHKSGKQIICGHTSQQSGLPAIFDGGICIDTWAYGGKWLTCFDTHQQRFLQANERGESRSFELHALIGKDKET